MLPLYNKKRIIKIDIKITEIQRVEQKHMWGEVNKLQERNSLQQKKH